jgi:orotate phosphoribosyltransferase
MSNSKVENILESAGAILINGHFLYTSGKHGSAYVNKDAIYKFPEYIQAIAREMADLIDDPAQVEVIVGPTMGGAILAQWVAQALMEKGLNAFKLAFAEEGPEKERVLKRGYDQLIPGKKVLVVEDILNTGISAKRTIDLIKSLGGTTVQLVALCNRGGVTADTLGLDNRHAHEPVKSLVNFKFEAWEPVDCPLCKKGIPFNTNAGKAKK